MKNYLIEIKASNGECLFTTIYGDTPTRPFMIANNLWNYQTPWTAARRLEKLAKSWERLGLTVTRAYGTVLDMPIRGDQFNAGYTIYNFT